MARAHVTDRSHHQELYEARRLVADLRTPNPRIFWTDLAITVLLTWSAIVTGALATSMWTIAGATLIAGLALTRALLFVHEITHARQGTLPWFRFAWNAVVGIPLLAPSYIYETVHIDHHRVNVYRTVGDPEHAPDEKSLFMRCFVALVGSLVLPLILLVRWLVLAPLSMFDAGLRTWVERHLSGLTTNRKYEPTRPSKKARRHAQLAEIACFVWAITLVVLVAFGVIPMQGVIVAMLAISIAMAVTDLRGEILHRFNDEGSFGTLERQVRDSVNIPHNGPMTWLLMPLGIAYHALHHLDMSIPYHNMREAHERLMRHLPKSSLYVRSTTDGILTATLDAISDDAKHRAENAGSNEVIRALG